MKSKKKTRRSAREAALRALVRVEQDGAYLNLALPALLNNFTADERALAVQLAAGTIQRLNTLDWAVNLFSRRSIETFTPWVRNLLRLSAYQIIYLDRIPDYAVVDEAVNLARRFGHRGVAGLVNALLRRLAAEREDFPWPDSGQFPVEYLSLRYSLPRWLAARMINRFGFIEAEKWSGSCNMKPLVSLRPNPLKTGAEELIKILKSEEINAFSSPVVPGMLRIETGAAPAGTRSFKEGLFTIQGESSALVAPLLSPQPGDTMVDLCSAPGGKSTHLAELMEDRGTVFAVEIHSHRLRLVENAAARLGLKSIMPVSADSRAIENHNLPEPSAVLVDAPCSGLGVIRRLPEIKWRRCEEDLPGMHALQSDLVSAAARLLPPGGKLLYSVCSGEPEETTRVVETFTGSHPQFILEDLHPFLPLSLRHGQDKSRTVSLWPHRHDLDGFFIALWRRKR